MGYIAYQGAALGEQLLKVQDTIPICPPQLSQHLALGAVAAGRPWVAERVAAIAGNRREPRSPWVSLFCTQLPLCSPHTSQGAVAFGRPWVAERVAAIAGSFTILGPTAKGVEGCMRMHPVGMPHAVHAQRRNDTVCHLQAGAGGCAGAAGASGAGVPGGQRGRHLSLGQTAAWCVLGWCK